MCNLSEGVYEDGMKKGLPHSVISECSGLSISEIEKIAAQA